MRVRPICTVAVLIVLLLSPTVGAWVGFSPRLTKSFSPSTILDGGTTVLTFTFTPQVGASDVTNVGFTDTLPSSLRVKDVTVGGSCPNASTATAVTAGGTTVTITNLTVPAVVPCTVTVNITNVLGQLNASCGANPSAFTNAIGNISGNTDLDSSQVTASCLVVTAAVPALPPWLFALLAVATVAAAGAILRRRVAVASR